METDLLIAGPLTECSRRKFMSDQDTKQQQHNDQENQSIQDGQVVKLDYTLTVDGKVVDTSEGNQPIQFIQGHGQIIPGLEDQLYGMRIGEQKDVVVQPDRGYGEIDPDNFADIPRNQFPPEIPLEPGTELELRDQDGQLMDARIAQVGKENVRLDFNHPLAGKELNFNVQVVGIRNATEEEISHGHVHEGHNHEH
jgi:FKBP-type peptidyl-prolyl cis-trans isomerase SlyD